MIEITFTCQNCGRWVRKIYSYPDRGDNWENYEQGMFIPLPDVFTIKDHNRIVCGDVDCSNFEYPSVIGDN